jgi:hypothetical protein
MLVALVCFSAWQKPALLAAQAGPHGSSLHIGVFVESNAGEPIGRLSAKDFILTSQGAVLPFRLVRPALGHKPPAAAYEPTRLLIVLSPHIANSNLALSRLLPRLDPVWHRGWQVTAILSNGNKTGYATSSEQLSQLCVNAQSSGSPQPETAVSAVHDLDTFAGRRLILYLANSTGKQEMPPKQILSAAKDAMAEIFAVNGGTLVSSDDFAIGGPGLPMMGGGPAAARASGEGFGSGAYAASTGPVHVSKQYDPGIYLAVNTRAAIRQATLSAQGYYSLRIRRASLKTLPPDTSLSLEIHLAHRTDYTVMAMAYGNNPPPILLAKK